MEHDAVTVALGFAIGILSGLFGVGGSSIATPLLRVALNTPSLIALASPLPATFPTATATGLAAYSREGAGQQACRDLDGGGRTYRPSWPARCLRAGCRATGSCSS